MAEVAAHETTSDGTAGQPAGFGAALAQAREAQGISIADMAGRLRLHPRQIAALEQERLEALPEAAFVRGFLRNYAKELRLDPAPLLAALAARQPVTEAAAPMIGGPSAEIRRAGVERASRLTVIVGAVLLIVVLGIVGWFASMRVERSADGSGKAAPAATVEPVRPASQPVESEASPAPAASAPAPEAGAPPSPAAATRPVPAPGSSASAAAAVLRLSVGDRPSWIEITQADGRVLLTGLQEAGTDRRLGPVQPPLRLVIGNASSVTLEYRGRAIDLASHVRANDLARLSLD